MYSSAVQNCGRSLTRDSCGMQREIKKNEQATNVGGIIANKINCGDKNMTIKYQ